MVIRTSLFGAFIALFLVGPTWAAFTAEEQLPNLNQAAPSDVHVQERVVQGQRRFELGFASATANIGAGPLTIHGYRSAGQRDMTVDQLVTRPNSTPLQVRSVGVMRYVVNPDHHHWHFLGFASYELRHAGALKARAGSDQKTGFCLGDRYRVRNARKLPGVAPFPEQGDQCGLGKPGLSGLFAGISVGWGDRYGAYLEGQYIDITRLPPGRYTLVHTANPEHTLRESDYSDNSASVSLRIDWPHGWSERPTVKVLARCQETPECG
jgi:hypothetical protein